MIKEPEIDAIFGIDFVIVKDINGKEVKIDFDTIKDISRIMNYEEIMRLAMINLEKENGN